MSFDYIRAIKRPFTNFNKLILGMILLLIPIVNIVTGFMVRGYKLESANTYNKKLPEWKNFGKLFVRGLLSWVIGLIYLIPAIVFLGISIGKIIYSVILQYGLNQGLSTNNPLSDSMIQNFLLGNGAMIPVFFIGLVLMIIAVYVIPMSIMEYIRKYKFKDAFDLRKVFKKAFTGKYFIAVIAVLLYGLIISLVSNVLQMGILMIKVQFLAIALTLIVTSLASFVVMITSYTIYGEVYSKIK